MESDNLSFEFLADLFKKKKEELIVQCIFEELNEESIVEELIEQHKTKGKKK